MKEQELFESILSAPNFGTLIVFIAADIREYLCAERFTIYQKGRDDDEVVSRFKTGNEFKEIRVPLGTSSIAGYVALSQQPLYFRDVYILADLQKIHPNLTYDKSFEQISGFRTKSMITVPIKQHNVLLGVLQVLNRLGGGEFSNSDASRVLGLADIIGKKFAKELDTSLRPYDHLIQQKLITPLQLEELERNAAKLKLHPSQLMVRELEIDGHLIGKSLENYYQVPYQPYDASIKLPRELLDKVSHTYLRKQLCMPIMGNIREAYIVIDDPTDRTRIMELQKVLGIENVIIRLSLPMDIHNFLGLDLPVKQPELSEIVELLHEEDTVVDNLGNLDDRVLLDPDAAPVVRLVQKIIHDAVQLGASDIHIEPGREKTPTSIRMRVDGICRTIQKIPAQYSESVLSRIKVMSRLDMFERRKPQDGKCKLKLGERLVELRVATIPTVNGEGAVLRILSNASALPIKKLNLNARNLSETLKLINYPHGIFLVVGPTGSGKTTTLHALLGYLNTSERKIWTAEDPVEITQEGLQQVQVIPKIGFDFAAAMRSFLRADPDVILIGEIRDRETAHIAIEASLTGHLVFSTLHTNSAVETVIRLLDLGLDPLNFADALLGVLAQRLVRLLCRYCKTAYHPDAVEIERLQQVYGNGLFSKLDLKNIKQQLIETHGLGCFTGLDCESERVILFKAVGCPQCDHTGYKGRIAIHELLVASPELKVLIGKGANVNSLRHQALEEGMIKLIQDGVLKILSGLIDQSQLYKVVAEQ